MTSGFDLWLLAPELWMIVLSCIILFLDFLAPRLRKDTLAFISMWGTVAGLLLVGSFFAAGREGSLFSGMFVVDRFALFFKAVVLTATLLIFLSSIDTVNRIGYFKGEFYYLLLFSALGMMFMASAADFLSLYVTIEFSTFGFYILVPYIRNNAESSEAGLKFFILGVLTSALLIFGISLIYGETGTIIFREIARVQTPASFGLVVGLLFVFIGLGFKVGAVPFHAWIPDVYQGAPTPVTSFLSIAPKAAAFAIFLRVVFSTFDALRPDWTWFLILASALSMTYGNVVAIAQRNAKRLLAYSGIAQIGNVLIGMAAGTKMGSDSVLFYLLTYLFANVGAFAVVIAFGLGTGSDDLADYDGLNRRSPLLAASMLVFLLSLAGVPPLAGFVGKIYLFGAAASAANRGASGLSSGLLFLIIIGLINIIISLYYYLVVAKRMYIFEPHDPAPIGVTPPLAAVIVFCLAGVFLLGIWPKPFIELSVASTALFSNLVPK